jgi:hypothetical protein
VIEETSQMSVARERPCCHCRENPDGRAILPAGLAAPNQVSRRHYSLTIDIIIEFAFSS